MTWGLQADDVVLVTSELVANAIQHARTAISVSLGLEDHLVTVKVADGSPRLPTI
jgi:anti-sigma regulatory factor (Ser/Thr protein kinase)